MTTLTSPIGTKPTFVPSCRHGHGAMVEVDRLDGRAAVYGIAHFQNMAPMPGDHGQFILGFRWFLCTTCGLTELYDGDPQATLANMGPPE